MTMDKEAPGNTPPLVTPRAGLYICERTSAYGEKPCDEAFKVLRVDTDVRNTDDPRKIPAHNGTDGGWYDKGTNHRVEGGRIMRDVGYETAWAVEIADVQAFVDKHGLCVVGRDGSGFCEIEIYDDYRE